MQCCAWVRGYEHIGLYLPQGQFYLECVHHTVDTKFYCCAKYVAISYMILGKENIKKSKALIYILSHNKVMIEWCSYFLYRTLYGNSSAGDGDCVGNRVHGSRVSECVFVGALEEVWQSILNKWHRVWITVQNCDPWDRAILDELWDREFEEIVCIGI